MHLTTIPSLSSFPSLVPCSIGAIAKPFDPAHETNNHKFSINISLTT